MSDELEHKIPELQEYPQEPEPPKPAEQAKEPKPEPQSDKEQNLRIMRERAEYAERRALEIERQLQQVQQPKVESTEEDFDVKDDDFIEGKHLKKYVRNLKKELDTTKQQLTEFNQQQAVTTAEMRLKSQFNDFDNVVTKANIDKLAEQRPALYRTIMASQDIYDRGYAAYELIRSTGIASDDYSAVDKKIEANKSKPRSSATVAPQTSDSPLSRAGDYDRRILSEERKAQLCKQVEEAKRNR